MDGGPRDVRYRVRSVLCFTSRTVYGEAGGRNGYARLHVMLHPGHRCNVVTTNSFIHSQSVTVRCVQVQQTNKQASKYLSSKYVSGVEDACVLRSHTSMN